jgi:YggT family protein
MFIFSNLVSATALVLDMVLTIYLWMIIIRALLTWVNPDPYNPVVRFLGTATDPVLWRARRLLLRVGLNIGGLDLSPIVVIVAIYFLQAFLVQSLKDLAIRLG